MVNVAVFASGSGSNAEKIMDYFKGHDQVCIRAVFTNNKKAGVIQRAEKRGIDVHVFNRNDFYNTNNVLELLNEYDTNLVVLAGFLWLVPENLLQQGYKVINIHPALLPQYGGAGMYGHHVHEAVKKNGEKHSGITIHFIDDEYDKGEIILQEKVELSPNDTPEQIASKVLKLEHHYYPRVIEKLAAKGDKI